MRDSLDVNEWLRFAQMDYDAAKDMSILHNPVPLEIVCYHCQQSAEKALKAYAIAKGEPLMKTHDLEALLEQCVKHDEQFNDLAQQCPELTTHVTLSRYPVGEDRMNEHDMKTALEYASNILEFTKSKLLNLGYGTEK